jgi:RNA polymerase sigma factor (TIGR02999 family)
MRRERVDHTLQPTALVNELFVRLLRGQPVAFESRAHFFATASQVMRRILVDHARQRAAGKRPPGERRAPLHEALISPGLPLELVLVLDDALTRLADFDPRHARLVEMRYFGGLTEMEIASAMGVSVRTVRRDWKAARAWLLGEMSGPVA